MDETVSEADRVIIIERWMMVFFFMTEDADNNHDDGVDKTLLESESGSEMSQTEDMSGIIFGGEEWWGIVFEVSQVKTVSIQDEKIIESAQALVNMTVNACS